MESFVMALSNVTVSELVSAQGMLNFLLRFKLNDVVVNIQDYVAVVISE
jgi:hypothetical protein